MKKIKKILIYVCLAALMLSVTGCNNSKKNSSRHSDVIYDKEEVPSSPELEEFIDNVCVIGDSIGVGYAAYGRIPDEHCCAQKGITLSQTRDNIFTVEGLGDYSAAEFTEYMQPEYLMVVLGMNDVSCGDPEGFAEEYMDFVTELHELSPDSEIYVMEITPVEYDMDSITNEGIDEYNAALADRFDGCSYAEFADAAEAVRGDDGYLDEECSAGDGIHLNETAYDRLLGQMQSYI